MPKEVNVEICRLHDHQANENKLKKLDKNERNYFYLKKQIEMFSSKKHELTIDEAEEEKFDPPTASPPQPPPPLLLKNQQIYSITYQTNLIVNQYECRVNKMPIKTTPKSPPTQNQASNIAVFSSNSSQRKDWHVAKIFILVNEKKKLSFKKF
jgi:hypothetical protein